MKRHGTLGGFLALAVVAAIIILIGSAIPALAGGYGSTGSGSYGTPALKLGGINSQSGSNNTQPRYGSETGTGSNTKYNTPYLSSPPKATSKPKMLPGQQSLSVEERRELNIMIPKTEEK